MLLFKMQFNNMASASTNRQWITEPDEYICTLSPEAQIVAKEELREDDHTRHTALASMREWIIQNPRIKNCRMGKIKDVISKIKH